MRRLRLLAIQKELTGRRLAELSGVDPSKISALQRGRYTPAPGSVELARVARALGIPASKAEWLLEEVDDLGVVNHEPPQ